MTELKQIISGIKGVFLPLKRKYYIGKLKHRGYIFGSFPIRIISRDLEWKDKYGTPRVELLPYFAIHFFNLEVSITFEANVKSQEKYFEMAIWYVFYCDKDIDKARSEWRWLNAVDSKSSWNDNYLINNKLQ